MIPPAPEPPPRRLSEDFRELLRDTAGRAVTFGELEQRLKGRGFALFLLILSVPFCFPITIPGLSMPFGVVILLLGVRIACGHKPDLPRFILRKTISHALLDKIVMLGLKLSALIEKLARPRMHFMRASPIAVNLIGIGLASGGIQLLLPLPPLIPLSNTIPALSVVLLTAGLMERDGIFVLAGYVVNVIAWIYFVVMAILLGHGIEHLWHWMK
ncbi:MAG: exopolysaccharide biosynthesis protein [Chthoniobacteraceae bacterium]